MNVQQKGGHLMKRNSIALWATVACATLCGTANAQSEFAFADTVLEGQSRGIGPDSVALDVLGISMNEDVACKRTTPPESGEACIVPTIVDETKNGHLVKFTLRASMPQDDLNDPECGGRGILAFSAAMIDIAAETFFRTGEAPYKNSTDRTEELSCRFASKHPPILIALKMPPRYLYSMLFVCAIQPAQSDGTTRELTASR